MPYLTQNIEKTIRIHVRTYENNKTIVKNSSFFQKPDHGLLAISWSRPSIIDGLCRRLANNLAEITDDGFNPNRILTHHHGPDCYACLMHHHRRECYLCLMHHHRPE